MIGDNMLRIATISFFPRAAVVSFSDFCNGIYLIKKKENYATVISSVSIYKTCWTNSKCYVSLLKSHKN